MEEFGKKGFRATPQRIAIGQIVLNSIDYPIELIEKKEV